jgi:spore maturation protein CgeB
VSWLGTYAPSRQAGLERLFLAPAARLPDRTFVLAGSMYDASFPWRENVRYVRHLEPALHPGFFCSSPLTVNVTRAEMAAVGHCPSPRLFEAAACGVPVLSDDFDGLDAFFTPGEELLVARTAEEAAAAIAAPRDSLARIGRRARERALAEHTADVRARELVARCEEAMHPDRDLDPTRDADPYGDLDRELDLDPDPDPDRDLDRDLDLDRGPAKGARLGERAVDPRGAA